MYIQESVHVHVQYTLVYYTSRAHVEQKESRENSTRSTELQYST